MTGISTAPAGRIRQPLQADSVLVAAARTATRAALRHALLTFASEAPCARRADGAPRPARGVGGARVAEAVGGAAASAVLGGTPGRLVEHHAAVEDAPPREARAVGARLPGLTAREVCTALLTAPADVAAAGARRCAAARARRDDAAVFATNEGAVPGAVRHRPGRGRRRWCAAATAAGEPHDDQRCCHRSASHRPPPDERTRRSPPSATVSRLRGAGQDAALSLERLAPPARPRSTTTPRERGEAERRAG